MKTAIFEYGKQPLAEWITQHRDCEKMVLVGTINEDNLSETFWEDEESEGDDLENYTIYHYHELMHEFDKMTLGLCIKEFDITDLHVKDSYLRANLVINQPSVIYRMLLNRKYATHFVSDGQFVTTPDGKVLVHCYKIEKSVVVPEGVQTIGCGAFALTDKLKFNVLLPQGLTHIDDYAFAWCHRLVKINFPNTLRTLGEYAFYSDSNLKEVVLPDGVTAIPASCFCDVSEDELHIPPTVKV